MRKVFLATIMVSSLLYSTTYEDAEDGNTNGWVASGGATISNVVDSVTNSKVIKLSSNSHEYYSLTNLANNSDKKISWDIKADNGFTTYVIVSTSLGERILYYSTTDINRSKTGNWIHHPLGNLSKNRWHTVTRDLEADIQDFEPNNHITAIKLFKIRVKDNAYLDNIVGLSSTTNPPVNTGTCSLIEDAEDGATDGWSASKTGANINNIVDSDTGSNVIQFSDNNHTYYSIENLNNSSKKIKFDIKANNGFTAYVVVSTLSGDRNLYYSTTVRNRGKDGIWIHHPLGDLTRNRWHTITRDLEADLQNFEPNNKVTAIKSFKIRVKGNASLDNLKACDGNPSVNRPPVANAGANQTVTTSTQVQLDGSVSSDADGDPLTYQWTMTSKPNGSSAMLSDATLVNPTFVADVDGVYTLQLIVNDGQTDSVADHVTITVGDGSSPVPTCIDPTTLTPEFD